MSVSVSIYIGFINKETTLCSLNTTIRGSSHWMPTNKVFPVGSYSLNYRGSTEPTSVIIQLVDKCTVNSKNFGTIQSIGVQINIIYAYVIRLTSILATSTQPIVIAVLQVDERGLTPKT